MTQAYQAFESIPETGEWKCFHCGEVFTTIAAAVIHFGKTETARPVCETDADIIRQMEEELRRYREEDTDLHRQIADLISQKESAVRRAEDLGYSRGLRDANHAEPETIAEMEIRAQRQKQAEQLRDWMLQTWSPPMYGMGGVQTACQTTLMQTLAWVMGIEFFSDLTPNQFSAITLGIQRMREVLPR